MEKRLLRYYTSKGFSNSSFVGESILGKADERAGLEAIMRHEIDCSIIGEIYIIDKFNTHTLSIADTILNG